ncbi:MAG: PASTA domain-containing protein [Candidatus Poribacteria bacterium]
MRLRWFVSLNGIFTISVVALLLWAGSVLGFLYSWIPNYVSGEVVTIPNLEGMPAEQAKQRVLALGLKINYAATETRYDAALPRGHVLSHVPAPRQSVKRTRPIRFILSSGPEVSTVPDLRQKTVEQAEFELPILGLRTGIVSHTHSERHTTPRSIIATTPAAGTAMTRGDRVHLLVSLGPRPVEMTMPRLTGMTLAQARKLAEEQLLYVDKVERQRRPREKPDVVLAQIPPAGSRVLSGSGVTLTVNEVANRADGNARMVIISHRVSGGVDEGVEGSEPGGAAGSQPTADGGGATDDPPAVEDSGTPENGPDVPLTDPLLDPLGDSLIRVRLMLKDDTGRREIYDEMARPGQNISMPRRVVGEAELTVYEGDMNEPVRKETLK